MIRFGSGAVDDRRLRGSIPCDSKAKSCLHSLPFLVPVPRVCCLSAFHSCRKDPVSPGSVWLSSILTAGSSAGVGKSADAGRVPVTDPSSPSKGGGGTRAGEVEPGSFGPASLHADGASTGTTCTRCKPRRLISSHASSISVANRCRHSCSGSYRGNIPSQRPVRAGRSPRKSPGCHLMSYSSISSPSPF